MEHYKTFTNEHTGEAYDFTLNFAEKDGKYSYLEDGYSLASEFTPEVRSDTVVWSAANSSITTDKTGFVLEYQFGDAVESCEGGSVRAIANWLKSKNFV